MAKARYFYINATGERIAAMGMEIKKLAAEGNITPETIIEFPDGRKGLAKDVEGLTFPKNPFLMGDSEIAQQPSIPIPINEELVELPKDEIPTRLMVLCICSLIPGLGHALLGRTVWKCSFMMGSSFLYAFLIILPFFLLYMVPIWVHDSAIESNNIEFTAPAGKFFRRVEFEEIFKLALCSVNSATCQFAHFRQTARFFKKI